MSVGIVACKGCGTAEDGVVLASRNPFKCIMFMWELFLGFCLLAFSRRFLSSVSNFSLPRGLLHSLRTSNT